MANADVPLEVVLIGHLIRHVMLVPDEHGDRYTGHVREATTPLLSDMITEALVERLEQTTAPPSTEPSTAISEHADNSARQDPTEANNRKEALLPYPKPTFVPSTDSFATLREAETRAVTRFGELHSVLDAFPSGSSKSKQETKVLRVRYEQLATTVVVPNAQGGSPEEDGLKYVEWLVKTVKTAVQANDNKAQRIMLLYDHSPYFREILEEWSKASDENDRRFSELACSCGAGLVLAINDAFDASWVRLVQRLTSASVKDCTDLRNRSIAVVSADALRKGGSLIMELGAFESSVRDVVLRLNDSPLKLLKDVCRHLVVVFRETGAMCLDHDTGEGSVTYAPNSDRHAQLHPSSYGAMPGKFTTMVTSVIRELSWSAVTKKPTASLVEKPWDIGGALRMGVAAYNLHFSKGFTKPEGNTTCRPIDDLKHVLNVTRRETAIKDTADVKGAEYLLTTVSFNALLVATRNWQRTDAHFDACRGSTDDEDGKLIDLVQKGLEVVFRHEPGPQQATVNAKPDARITVPYAPFGKLKLFESDEIESLNSLAKLIDKYLNSPTWRTPLSIAVFGQPGSGKSFSVKEVLQRVSPDRKSDPLTFNMAQFVSVDQLTEAFHKVQDKALASSEVPLVIFDEFDAAVDDRPLGWLKYFLAPMQDGVFMGKSEEYRVGRAIFLFSGGISERYADFSKETGANAKSAKLPDFVSRLRGHLDVGGINPLSDEEAKLPVARLIRLRRAVVLRSMLDQHASAIIRASGGGQRVARISENLIRAFLHTRKYVHGVRSMEAVIQMSRFIDGQFVPASLPTYRQLEMHVDQASFLEKLREPVFSSQTLSEKTP
ncbi:AAA family ATPase [Paraburkholderia sp. RL17-337-BIB-A]|uniref:AAA family ATPase n=1 Tax=Paraburkholderia sp. RL17-337-BIB-A TaxID=3031636 RepID=UPI0038B8E4A3